MRMPMQKKRPEPRAPFPSRAPGRTPAERALAAALACCLAVLCAAPAALAGTVVNKDHESYPYAVYWDDLGPVEKGVIKPGETLVLKPKSGIVELVGRHDNIYIRAEDTVTIVNGILQGTP